MAQLTAERLTAELTAQQLQELKAIGTVTVGSKAYEEAEGRFYVNLANGTASDSYTEGAYSTVNGLLVFDLGAGTVSLTGEYVKDWGTGETVAYRTAEARINDYHSTGKLQLN